MALKDNASLALIPAAYKTSKVYSAIPTNGDGDFTFSRSGTGATRINKAGLVETMGANVPRLNYDLTNGTPASCPSLLLEPTRTNSTTYSEDFTNWGDVGVTLTPNATIAPNGALTATKFVSTANNWRKSSSFAGSSGTTYTVSVFAKLDTTTSTTTTQIEIFKGASGFVVDFNLSNQTISGTGFTNAFIEEYPNNWFRIGGTYTANGTNQILYLYPSSSYGIGGTMFFWGAQVEAGSYPTSYIPTTTAAVTKTKDRCTGGGDDNLFNDSEGVVFVDAEALSDADVNRYITLSDGTLTNAILIQYRNNGQLRLYNGGIGSANLIFADYSADLTERKKIAIQYGTNANDYKVYINGVSQIISGSFSATSMNGLDRFRFDYVVDTLEFFGKVYQTMVFNTALTDAELITLTT